MGGFIKRNFQQAGILLQKTVFSLDFRFFFAYNKADFR